MVAPAGYRQIIVESFRHQPQSPHKKGCTGAIAAPEVKVASWLRNLFERNSFIASGKARHNASRSWYTIQCARGCRQEKRIPNSHQIGKRERGTVSVLDFGGMISGYQSVSVFTLKQDEVAAYVASLSRKRLCSFSLRRFSTARARALSYRSSGVRRTRFGFSDVFRFMVWTVSGSRLYPESNEGHGWTASGHWKGGEEVTEAMVWARIRVDGRLAAVCRRFWGRRWRLTVAVASEMAG